MAYSGKRSVRNFLAAIFCLALAACGGSTPYQPLSASNTVAGGYSDIRLGPDSFRVTFAGNTLTSQETVEQYLLYRAAELTLDHGYDAFRIETSHLEHEVEREITERRYDVRLNHWTPYWNYYRNGRGWYPCSADRLWCDNIDIREVDRYEASADITLLRGDVATDDDHVFDARALTERMQAIIKRPE